MVRRDFASSPVVAAYGGIELHWHARELRGERTLADMAREIGMNRDELARIERGETVQIRFETLAKLMSGFGCGISDLLEAVPTTHHEEYAPWLAPLSALKDGRVRHGVPARHDPDDALDEALPPALASGFREAPSKGVRRSAFRPPAQR
jgi:DNA-binding Xre family transcriptional regulator